MGGMIRPGTITGHGDPGLRLRAGTAPLPNQNRVFADRSARSDAVPHPALAARARALYDARRLRDAMLDRNHALFHDPAWDILLDLFARCEDHQMVTVSSACVASCVPHSTALRCLKAMERAGVIALERDPFDKRRRFVALSRDMHERMTEWLLDI